MASSGARSLDRGFTMRVVLALATIGALLALFGNIGPADAAPAKPLRGAAACPGADDPFASEAAQRKAIICLVNAARSQFAKGRLATPTKLQKASALKGKVVASCGQLSHTPCGAAPTESIQRSGYRYGWFGENLWLGTWGHFSARQVVDSWLNSPPHRANVLRASFRHFGIARARAEGVFGEPSTAVWVATFASPR